MRHGWAAVGAALAIVGCGGAVDPSWDVGSAAESIQPSASSPTPDPAKRVLPVKEAARPKGGGGTNGIAYHGGPLLVGPSVPVYLIWYGSWSSDTAPSIVGDFVSNVGGSPYYAIQTTYFDASNKRLSNSVSLAGTTTDAYSRGASLGDKDIAEIVATSIRSGRFPSDPGAVYFVLTSSDVTETSGFCTQYCGWHTHAGIDGVDIKYSFVGNPARCLSSCAAQATSPNGNPGADGMVSIVAHELVEAASDPDLNAWYDVRGRENADKCAWTFGTTQTASNGSKYNVVLGSRQYLVQQNWVNAGGGYCSMRYP